LSLEINIIITSVTIGFLLFGFYQAGKHRVFEKWLEKNDSKQNENN
jgi:hypothetical protein